jgi:catechol 2,3-dioxygenase-like lactoylglutathione lyase family enzyme
MKKKLGFNHIDLATTNMAATRAFYEDILGFKVVRHDVVKRQGYEGYSEHVFFDCGNGQLIAFSGAEHSPGRWPANLDTSINKPLGLPGAPYHFAFEAESVENLHALKADLEKHGVAVRGVRDHEGWCSSIYFLDPNGLQMEYCCLTRELTSDDAKPQERYGSSDRA